MTVPTSAQELEAAPKAATLVPYTPDHSFSPHHRQPGMPAHPQNIQHIPGWGWVLHRQGDSQRPSLHYQHGQRQQRLEGTQGKEAGQELHWQSHSPAWCCPKANQGTLTQGKDLVSGRKSLWDQDRQGLAAPHTTWLPREAAGPLSWRCYREGLAGTSHCRACC